MTHADTTHIKSELEAISNKTPGSLRAAVADEALDYCDPQSFFTDLLKHGCISGMVCSLIYYADTHAFFDTHYSEIETLREETEDNLGMPLTIKGDMKNFLAWFAFEETACQIAMELDLI